MYRNGLEFLKASIPKFRSELTSRFEHELFLVNYPEAAKVKPIDDEHAKNVIEERYIDMVVICNEGADQANELVNLLLKLQRTGESLESLTARIIQSVRDGALGNPETKDS